MAFSASHAVPEAGSQPEQKRERYIVIFDAPALAEWTGGEVERGHRLKATAPAATGKARLDPESTASRAYLDYLDRQRRELLERVGGALKRAVIPSHVYEYALNGLVLTLGPQEAARVAKMEGVARVMRDEILPLETDAGPEWIGAPQVWSGQAPFSGDGNQGEGVVIGIIDSGVNPRHKSFADVGDDGFDHDNPRNRRFGLCASGAPCNDKLIGLYDFTEEGTGGEDSTGHGTHVASIAAGNHVDANLNARTNLNLQVRISGVAPHANIISYKACQSGDGELQEGCPFSALLDAIDQAVADGVDVINYSIGSFINRESPWARPDASAMRNAVASGIVVVSSAGNEGPETGSITHPATAPWVIAAANATHDRRFINRLTSMSGGNNPPPMTLTGAGFTSGVGPRDIVHAKEFGNALCGEGPQDFPPTGASNPFERGTFNGEIVVCDRGKYARVEKGFNVNQAGAGGYVLANTPEFGEGVVSDDHFLPAVHLGFSDSEKLRTWLDAGGNTRARITGAQRDTNDSLADVIAASSSRGPAVFTPDVMKPDLAAPGTDILGADMPRSGRVNSFQFLSGTSMASPHVAGSAALVRAVHPDWSPMQVQSALLTTAVPEGMVDSLDGSTAGARTRGAGRVNPAAAVAAGLLLEESVNAFVAADPDRGGDPKTLNLAALSNHACFLSCQWRRTVTAVRGGITWRVEVDAPPGVKVEVTPQEFTLQSAGDRQTLDVKAVVRNAPMGAWISGGVRLTPVAGGGPTPETTLPLNIFVSPGKVPDRIEVGSATRAGLALIPVNGLVALSDLTLTASGPVEGKRTQRTLRQDPSRNNPYDNLNDGTTFFRTVTVKEGDRYLAAEVLSSTAQDIDLFVGRDGGDGEPELREELCASTSPNEIERCELFDPAPGDYWVLVQNWQATGNADTVELVTAVVPDKADGLTATGPATLAVREAFDVRLSWDRLDMSTGSRWYGLLAMGTDPGNPENVGLVPVILQRGKEAALAPLALVPGESRRLSLPGDTAHKGLFVDLPPDVERLTVDVKGGSFANIALFARLAEPPGGDTLQDLSQSADAEAVETEDGLRLELDVAAGLVPGRWFITPFNDAFSNVDVTIETTVETRGELIAFDRGMWFNPARSGHGIDLNVSGDFAFVVWFTYLEDGTPVWYLASGRYEDNIWSAPLLRFTWNGDEARETTVGRVTMTFLSPTSAVFSWRLHGLTGSEPFRPCVGSDICIPANLEAPPVDHTGHWFDPAEPGWGDTVVTRGAIELHTIYVYDAKGNPRWLQGVNSERNESNVTELFAFDGFCPLCERVEPETTPAGTIATTFSGQTTGTFDVDAELPPAWPGEWVRDTDVEQLSDPAQ